MPKRCCFFSKSVSSLKPWTECVRRIALLVIARMATPCVLDTPCSKDFGPVDPRPCDVSSTKVAVLLDKSISYPWTQFIQLQCQLASQHGHSVVWKNPLLAMLLSFSHDTLLDHPLNHSLFRADDIPISSFAVLPQLTPAKWPLRRYPLHHRVQHHPSCHPA